MVSEQDLGWLAGFFDGEGSLRLRKGKSGPPYIEVKIANTNKALIEKAQSILDALEIDSSLFLDTRAGDSRRKPKYDLAIESSSSVSRFFSKVPISHPDQLKKYDASRAFLTNRSYGHGRARRARLARQYPHLL